MVERVVRVVTYVAEQFVVGVFDELLDCWIIS